MPRSRMDPYKRNCAQAIHHLNGAIIDLQNVYERFLPQHPEMAEQLKTAMLGIFACKEGVVLFIGEAWNLDEDRIKIYIG